MSRKLGMTRKILLADDHSPTRMMFSQILDGHHYQIIHASNGEEAYSLALFERPHLILMDVMMPVMDGYEALVKIKEDLVTQTIPVMMLTATDRPLERRLAREMGAVGYMVKPVRVDELYHNINFAMAYPGNESE
jgi:CheY-like chemotaxis protein